MFNISSQEMVQGTLASDDDKESVIHVTLFHLGGSMGSGKALHFFEEHFFSFPEGCLVREQSASCAFDF